MAIEEAQNKVVTLDHALVLIDRIRRAGKSIVLISGYFDLYNIDYIKLIENAKRFGDFLVVVVYDSLSDCIIFNNNERCLTMASNANVNIVMSVEYDDMISTLNVIKPNYVVISNCDRCVWHDKVSEYGGKIAKIPLEHSIDSLADSYKQHIVQSNNSNFFS